MPRTRLRLLALLLLLSIPLNVRALEPGELVTVGSLGVDLGVITLGPFGGPGEVVVPIFYSSFALDADGTLVAESGGNVVRVNLETGVDEPISSAGPLNQAADILVSNGFAYGVDDSATFEGVIRVDLSNGDQALVASKGNFIDPKGAAIDGQGLLYVADPGDGLTFDDGQIVLIDPNAFDADNLTANQTVIVTGLANPWAVAFDAGGDLLVGDSAVVRRIRQNPDDSWSEVGIVSPTLPIFIRDLEIDDVGDVIAVGFDVFSGLPGMFRVDPNTSSAGTVNSTIGGPNDIEVAPGVPQLQTATERIASNLERPVYATAPPFDSRVFILEQAGRILLWKDGAVLNTPFLDISPLVAFDPNQAIGEERGLLGLAFAPDHVETGVFYVMYTAIDPADAQGPGRNTIARFTTSPDPDVANPVGDLLVSIPKPGPPENDPSDFEAFHNGGHLAFGPDGLLYAGVGDGGTPVDPWECAQNPSSLLGKLLRLDPAAIPQGGITVPVAAQCPLLPGGATGLEIWSTGLRNPYRFAFDELTDDLYIADVGESIFEEINVVAASGLQVAGPNFGWDIREGTFCNTTDPAPGACPDPALTDPTYTYLHRTPPPGGFCNGSVIGGLVYRGSIAELRGNYFYADYCRVFIQSLVWDGATSIVGAPAERTLQLQPDMGAIEFVSAIGEDGAGELLIVDYGTGFGSDGEVFVLVPVPEPSSVACAASALLCLVAVARLSRT